MPGAHGGVAELVDEDESAERMILLVRLEYERLVGGELAMPMAFKASVFAARCSSVLTFTWYFGCWTVAVTVCVPSFSQ